MSSSGKGKAKASSQQSTLGSNGDDWRLGKKPATPNSRGTTMTLRKSHTANLERSPTVFPTAKMSTFADAPSAEKRKILDEGDRRSQEERAKIDKRTPSRGGGSSSNDKPDNVDSPPLAHHGQKRTDSEKKRGRARTARQVAAATPSKIMKASPDRDVSYIA